MELDYEDDPGLELLARIIDQEHFLKTGREDSTESESQSQTVKMQNIIEIALGKDFTEMHYLTDNTYEVENPNVEKKKTVFLSTNKSEAKKIKLMKDYFATGDLKPLQDYLDELMEG